jgi:hypothetical protein
LRKRLQAADNDHGIYVVQGALMWASFALTSAHGKVQPFFAKAIRPITKLGVEPKARTGRF